MSGIRLDHIAIAVPNIEEALHFYCEQLGMHWLETEIVEEQGVRVAKLELGNTHLELLEPLSEDTPVGKFLKHHGPGLHHMCVGTLDIEHKLEKLKACGARLIDEQPRLGASGAQIAFVHPKSTGGVLLELSQPALLKTPD